MTKRWLWIIGLGALAWWWWARDRDKARVGAIAAGPVQTTPVNYQAPVMTL